MKKVLFTANLDSFFIKFLIPQFKKFKELGYEVHVASKSENIDIPYCDKKYNVDFARNMSLKQNIKSLKQLKKILDVNHYEIISCHTPFGGFVTRLACKNLKNTKVIYTAHGFHFYKGASIINWLLFYNVEKYLSKYTDTIITINNEDFEIAKRKFKKTNVRYVHGIGVDEEKFKNNNLKKDELRKSLNIKKDDFVLMFPAELNNNKNQKMLIEAIKLLQKEIPKIKLLLPGNDSLNGEYQSLVKKYDLDNKVLFLGFRSDIADLLSITSIAVSSSKREGLAVNLMEAVYGGIPIVATNNRGHRDFINNGFNGYLVGFDVLELKEKILYVYNNYSYFLKNSKKHKEKIEKYLIKNVLDEIFEIYFN